MLHLVVGNGLDFRWSINAPNYLEHPLQVRLSYFTVLCVNAHHLLSSVETVCLGLLLFKRQGSACLKSRDVVEGVCVCVYV